jgi:CDP-diacylglycerol--serine O-phosphatidyltransferase
MAEAFDDEPEVGEAPAAAGALRRRGIYLLPNLFTTGVLFCGFFAIVQAMNGRFEVGAIAIFVALVLDGMDGRVARWTNTQSEFGAQYDSIADMVAFGAAPALMTYVWVLKELGTAGWIGAFIYCAGLEPPRALQRQHRRGRQALLPGAAKPLRRRDHGWTRLGSRGPRLRAA